MTKLNLNLLRLWPLALFCCTHPLAAAVTVIKLHDFDSRNGAYPFAGLIQHSDGHFYGATEAGGGPGDHGTIFRLSSNGTFTSLYAFNGGEDGRRPQNPLYSGSDGALYGCAVDGGLNHNGVVFRISTNGIFSRIHAFTGGTGGNYPSGGLVALPGGKVYGTTIAGGSAGAGTVFEITRNGVLTTIHSFPGFQDRLQPQTPHAGLARGADGNLYGTTGFGGLHDLGTVFRITPAGALTRLYSFTGLADGGSTQAPLTPGPDGEFYGITPATSDSNSGTVFRITTAGEFATIHTFRGGDGGAHPLGGLTLTSDDYLFGCTMLGGTNNSGTLYRIARRTKVFESLHSFGFLNGQNPAGQLIQSADGALYGSTSSGGRSGFGTLFRLSIPPANDNFTNRSPITTIPASLVAFNTDGSRESQEPLHASTAGGASLWWSWKADLDGYVSIDTTGSSIDTVLAVYEGETLGGLRKVEENDDAAGTIHSRVTFLATSGVEYKLVVDGKNGAKGAVKLNLSRVAPPNDSFRTPFFLFGESDQNEGSNVGATAEPGEGGRYVWWAWKAQGSGLLNLDTTGSEVGTYLGIFSGNTPTPRYLFDASSPFGAAFIRNFKVTANTTYLIALGGYSPGESGKLSINLNATICDPPQVQGFQTVQETRKDGVHLFISPDVSGVIASYLWTIRNGNLLQQPDRTAAILEVVLSPTDDSGIEVDLTVTDVCGGGATGSSGSIPACGVCLSRGTPKLLTDGIGASLGPVTNIPTCGVLTSTARWYKVLSNEDSGPMTISAEGNPPGTLLVVFGGQLLPGRLSLVGCDTSTPSHAARVTFDASSKAAYWVALQSARIPASQLRLAAGFDPRLQPPLLKNDGSLEMQSSEAVPMTYRLQSTADLSLWTTVLTTNMNPEFPRLLYREQNARAVNQRYFRLIPGP